MKNIKPTNFEYLFQFSNLDLSNLIKANSFFQQWKIPKIDKNDGLKSVRNWQNALHKVFNSIIEKNKIDNNSIRYFEIQFKQIPQDIFWKVEDNLRIVLTTEPVSKHKLGMLDLPQATFLSRPEPYLEKLTLDLFTFLNKENISKLKKCEKCEEFFRANKVDNRTKLCTVCSPKNKMTKNQRNKYQREYYWKKKNEKLAKEHEAKIANYMDKLSCTREEAEKIIKADSIL
jgi:hypothetical protein